MKTYIKHSGWTYFKMWIIYALFRRWFTSVLTSDVNPIWGASQSFCYPVIVIISYQRHSITVGSCYSIYSWEDWGYGRSEDFPPRSHGWWAAEHMLSLSDSWDCVLSCSRDSVPRLGWPVGKKLKRRRLHQIPWREAQDAAATAFATGNSSWRPAQAFLPPWCLVKNARFLNISKVRYLLIFDLSLFCLQLFFVFVAFIHCSVRLLVSFCWCFMLLRLISCLLTSYENILLVCLCLHSACAMFCSKLFLQCHIDCSWISFIKEKEKEKVSMEFVLDWYSVEDS